LYKNQAALNVRFKTLTMRLGIKLINCSQKNSNLNEISPLSLILMQTNTDKHFFAKKVLTDLAHISIIRPALSDEVLTKKNGG